MGTGGASWCRVLLTAVKFDLDEECDIDQGRTALRERVVIRISHRWTVSRSA